MPILLTLDTAPGEGGQPDQPCRLDFASVDGAELIEFDSEVWINRRGTTGLDLTPREIVSDRIVGLPGSRLVQVNDLPRDIVTPIMVRLDPGLCRDMRAQLARLRTVLDYRRVDYAALEGHADLVATSCDGAIRRLRVSYVDGAEGNYGDRGDGWAIFALRWVAHNPYWRGDEWTTPLVGVASGEAFLSTNPADGWPRKLSASVAIGEGMPVPVRGDVPSEPVIDIIGPATSTHITSPSGIDVTIGAVAAGETFRLDTRRGVSPTLNGVEAWDLLSSAPRFAALPPGDTTISIVATGATSATRVRVWGDTLWESPW